MEATVGAIELDGASRCRYDSFRRGHYRRGGLGFDAGVGLVGVGGMGLGCGVGGGINLVGVGLGAMGGSGRNAFLGVLRSCLFPRGEFIVPACVYRGELTMVVTDIWVAVLSRGGAVIFRGDFSYFQKISCRGGLSWVVTGGP